ncbi:MAG TPA: alpha/beta hydrolase [Jatrophihabitans sp.]
MKVTVPAIVGGAIGVVSAVAAAGVAHERRQVNRERAGIDPKVAALFGALPIDRESVVTATDGVALHVEEVGPVDAPLTVVFVHGFALNLGAFHFQRRGLTEAFGDRIRMVFFDQRSHGRSGRSESADCTIEQTALDLDAVIAALVPSGPIVLVAHSMGGMTIMSLADQRPELFRTLPVSDGRLGQFVGRLDGRLDGGRSRGRGGHDARVRGLVLINTSSGNLKTVTLGLPSFLARLRGPILPLVLRRAAKSADLVERGRALGKDLAWTITKRLSFASQDVPPAVVAYCTNMIAATPVTVVSDFYPTLMAHDGTLGLMNLLDCEVVVFGADHDALTPLAHSEAIAAALPHAELVVVPESGHLLMLEHPAVVNRRLIAMITAVSAESGSTRLRSRVRSRK